MPVGQAGRRQIVKALVVHPWRQSTKNGQGSHGPAAKPRVLIAVSKFGHCLHDLLHRRQSGVLGIDVPVVFSNHDDMRSFTEWNGLPYVCVPNAEGKAAQEAKLLDLVTTLDIDLVVLARYMQVLSLDLCPPSPDAASTFTTRFCPASRGPSLSPGLRLRREDYRCDAHYVTTDLDEGPIIEQDVQRVHHEHTPKSLVELGRDVECRVLARAVRWHAEHRVLIEGSKTVVLPHDPPSRAGWA